MNYFDLKNPSIKIHAVVVQYENGHTVVRSSHQSLQVPHSQNSPDYLPPANKHDKH